MRHTAQFSRTVRATLAELMARIGHSTPQAALRYQHVAQGRDAQIAARMSKEAEMVEETSEAGRLALSGSAVRAVSGCADLTEPRRCGVARIVPRSSSVTLAEGA